MYNNVIISRAEFLLLRYYYCGASTRVKILISAAEYFVNTVTSIIQIIKLNGQMMIINVV